MLLPRLLTALVAIPMVVFLIHWGGLTYSIFIIAITVLALYEYGLILALGGLEVQRLNLILGGAALATGLILGAPQGLVLSAWLSWVLTRELLSSRRCLGRIALTLLGAVLLGWMPAHLALIRDLRPHGERITFMFYFSVWAMDSAAYFMGHLLGRHQLAPKLSPKKSWEGAVAGFIAAMGMVLVFRAFSPEMISKPRALVLGLLIGVGGQLSDLVESMIKRAVGAKDSGALLPGHGGVMDRFDSFILSAPAVYYCLALI
jgi:phosphatidate cytidylyltransferase